ncbi:Rv3654c family TadE-like protein [Streptomyces corynorhini]|uniref:Rv3654c family TadE-like protein n=1 Tax=Streptomyces corynorhini TaxID=2282652 RepID=UPI00389A5063
MCAVFAVVLAMGQAVAARHRAGAVADLAALAAADHALAGPAEACRRAVEVAAAQGGEVVRCSLSGEISDVTARAAFGPYTPAVRARAGPAGPPFPPRPPPPRPSPSPPDSAPPASPLRAPT